MLKLFIRLGTVFVFGSTLTSAAAASPVWGLDEVYSNADGSIQFAVHSTSERGQQYLRGETLAAGGQDIQTHLFVFPNDLPGDSAGRSFLIATQGFADLNVLQPDYIVPNGFFPASGGFISVAGHGYGYLPVPTDGARAYWQEPDVVYWYAPAVATNYAGERYAPAAATGVPAIGLGFTGTWFNPLQGNQGFAIQVLPGAPMQLLATWFTFAPQGGPSWILALGPISGDGATLQGIQAAGAGARFPPNLDSGNVQIVPWGTLTFSFSDCDHGHVDWSSSVPGYGSGGMDLTRLTLPAGLTCPN